MLSGGAIARTPGISPLHDVKKSAGSPVRRAETVLLPSSMDAAPAAGTFSAARRKRRIGGARRDRTDDLKLAKLPLSQLSYGPVPYDPTPPQKWWAWEDLNFRPHAYQARALTN